MGECCLKQAIGGVRDILEALCRDAQEEKAGSAKPTTNLASSDNNPLALLGLEANRCKLRRLAQPRRRMEITVSHQRSVAELLLQLRQTVSNRASGRPLLPVSTIQDQPCITHSTHSRMAGRRRSSVEAYRKRPVPLLQLGKSEAARARLPLSASGKGCWCIVNNAR
jgi:hypothetical protein